MLTGDTSRAPIARALSKPTRGVMIDARRLFFAIMTRSRRNAFGMRKAHHRDDDDRRKKYHLHIESARAFSTRRFVRFDGSSSVGVEPFSARRALPKI